MNIPILLLESEDKPSKSVSPTVATTSTTDKGLATCGQTLPNLAYLRVRRDMDRLLTGCHPSISITVHHYLEKSTGADRALLDAWARFGRRDRAQTVDISVKEAARASLTPLGLACLVSYARAWIDEAESIRAQGFEVAGSSSATPDGGPKRPQSGRKRKSLARATARRKRKR